MAPQFRRRKSRARLGRGDVQTTADGCSGASASAARCGPFITLGLAIQRCIDGHRYVGARHDGARRGDRDPPNEGGSLSYSLSDRARNRPGKRVFIKPQRGTPAGPRARGLKGCRGTSRIVISRDRWWGVGGK